MPISPNQPPQSVWMQLKSRKKQIYGFLLDSKKEALSKLFGDFIKRSFKEGTIQDMLHGAKQ